MVSMFRNTSGSSGKLNMVDVWFWKQSQQSNQEAKGKSQLEIWGESTSMLRYRLESFPGPIPHVSILPFGKTPNRIFYGSPFLHKAQLCDMSML